MPEAALWREYPSWRQERLATSSGHGSRGSLGGSGRWTLLAPRQSGVPIFEGWLGWTKIGWVGLSTSLTHIPLPSSPATCHPLTSRSCLAVRGAATLSLRIKGKNLREVEREQVVEHEQLVQASRLGSLHCGHILHEVKDPSTDPEQVRQIFEDLYGKYQCAAEQVIRGLETRRGPSHRSGTRNRSRTKFVRVKRNKDTLVEMSRPETLFV